MWVWMLIAGAIAIGYYLYQKSKAAQTTSTTADNNTGAATTGTPSSLIPEFVNQTYTNVTPPAAPNPSNPTQIQNVPASPSGFSVTPYTDYADFGWTGVSGAPNYALKIYNGNSLVANETVSGTHAVITGLLPGTTYKAQVSDPITGAQPTLQTFTTKKKGTKENPPKQLKGTTFKATGK
jgi:hypothetical protein